MAAITEPAKRRRGPGRPWRPGQSGNPSGLSADVTPLIAGCRRLALQHASHAIARLASLLDSDDERVVIAAAEGLLDRAGLRPFAIEPERVEVSAVPVDVDALRAALALRVTGPVRPLASAEATLVPAPPREDPRREPARERTGAARHARDAHAGTGRGAAHGPPSS